MAGNGGSNTLFEELDAWARTEGLDGDSALETAVGSFYERCLRDDRLRRFFVGVDMKRLQRHQFNFMRYAFSEGRVGRYHGKNMYRAHRRLIEEEGMNATHFDYVAGEAARGLGQVALSTNVPVIFGVLTTDTVGQAEARAGEDGGMNKGRESALAGLRMARLFENLREDR